MATHNIKKGLDLPITGAPVQTIEDGPRISRVAIVNDDYPFMKPRMHVVVGDEVKQGQLLFEDRKTEGVRFTAPAAGKVVAINRGERRVLQTLVIEVADKEEHVEFGSYKGKAVAGLDAKDVRDLLVESGMWTAIRQRPFSKVPSPEDKCQAIFVTACDSRPLAGDVAVALEGRQEDLEKGLEAIKKLTDGKVYFCRAVGSKIGPGSVSGVDVEEFGGPHPSGLAGTHIHMLAPVSNSKLSWYIDAQDVAAIGALFATGRLSTQRVVSVAGPAVSSPTLVRTRVGASIDELTAGRLKDGEVRVVSGSVLGGRKAMGEVHGFLGRYHGIVSCLHEDSERVFLGWLGPGMDKFSTVRAFLSGLLFSKKKYAMTTTTHGSHRAMVPIGMFERVMPLDIMPTFLLRSLIAGDLEKAEKLGALELDEEDLGLCSFVSPGKEDYGVILRKRLTTIWKEG